MSYIQTILCDFSDDLKRVDVIVDGFAIVDTSCRSSIGGGYGGYWNLLWY